MSVRRPGFVFGLGVARGVVAATGRLEVGFATVVGFGREGETSSLVRVGESVPVLVFEFADST